MHKRIEPFVGDTSLFYGDLVEKGVFSFEELFHAIQNNTCNSSVNPRTELVIDGESVHEIWKTVGSWVPLKDVLLISMIFEDVTIDGIATFFNCNKLVIEHRVYSLFGTRDLGKIIILPIEEKKQFYNKAFEEYEKWLSEMDCSVPPI